MARDLSKLSPASQAHYEKKKTLSGEVEADAWYDKYTKEMGIDTTAAPATAQPFDTMITEGVSNQPKVRKPQPPKPQPPQPPPTKFPTATEMGARLGAGEFAVMPSLEDVTTEEYKALEAQTAKAKKAGVPTKSQVSVQIASDLQAEGLQPFGETAAQFNKRMKEELDKSDYAEKVAMRAVAPARQPLTVGFEQKPPIAQPTTLAKAPEQVATMSGFEAIGQALLPQELETPAQTAARQTAKQNQEQLDSSADALALSKGISKQEARKQILAQLQDDFLTQAKAEIGLTEPDKEEWKRLARKNYLQYLEQNLPQEYVSEITRDEDEAAFGIAGSASSPKAAVEQVYAPMAADLAFGFLTSDKYDPEVYKDLKVKAGITPRTDAVVESLPMTIVRDLGGLSRFVFNPLLDAVMYDIEPGTDKMINPEEYGFLARERSGAKEERAWGKTYIATPSGDIFTDQAREIAVEIATGRSLGDDLAAQQVVRPESENAYRGLGILAEVALPINVFSVPGKVAGMGGRAVKATRFADMPYVSGIIKASELAEDPLSAVPGLINAYRIDKNLYKPLVEAAKKGGISTADEIRKSSKLADALVDSNRVSIIEAANAGDRYAVLATVAKSPDDLMTNPLYAAQVARLREIAPDIVKALEADGVNAKVLARKVLDNAMSSKNTVTRDAAKIADSSVGEGFVTSFTEQELSNVRGAVRTSLQESLSNTLLGQWSFITPNIVISTKTAKSRFPGTKNTVVQELSNRTKAAIDDLVDTVPKGEIATFKLKKDIDLDKLLKDSLVFSRPDRKDFYQTLFRGTSSGSSLSPEQYRALHNLVSEAEVGKATRAQQLGAFKTEGSGRAYKSASEPVELRSSLIQFSKQLGEDYVAPVVGKLSRRSFRDAPVKRYISDIINTYTGALETLPAQFSRTISALGKKGFKEDQIFGEFLNRALTEPQGAATVTDVVKPMSNIAARKALRDIMRIQFGVSTDSPKGKAIDKMSLEWGRSSFIDPTDNAKTFLKKAKELRDDIVRRFPELKDQEVVAQSIGARIVGRDSLPDTILAHSTKITQDKILADIIKRNRNAIYDNSAVAFIDRASTLEGRPLTALAGITKKEVIDGVSAGVVARLNGLSDSADIIKAIKDAGVSDDAIVDLGDVFVKTINAYYVDILRATHGFESADGAEVLRRLNLKMQEIEPGVLVFLPDALKNDIKVINENLKILGRDPVKASRVIATINEVERQSPGRMSRVFGDLASLAGYLHKNIAEGMLAGKVIPNVTYLSENVFTAPLISAVTNPQYIGQVLKSVLPMALETVAGQTGARFGRFGAYTADLYEPALKYPNKIAFVTPQGEQITNARLWQLFTEARIGAGQAETVLRPQSVAQLKQLAQLAGAENIFLKEASRRFKDVLPLQTASVPMTVAQNTDMAFRQALFKEALKRGKTPEEAATIARETLLDYSLIDRIFPDQMKALKAPFMFLSFATSMSAAILKAVTRGETAENILKMARFHNNMAKYSGVYAPGQSELEALYVEQQREIGDKPATYTYFRDPIFGQIFWMGNMVENLTFFLNGGTGGELLLSQFDELGYSPYIGLLTDLAGVYDKSFVPARQIALAKSLDMWESAQSNFDIEEVPLTSMRRGEPTFDGKQYRFKTKAGKSKYISFMFLLTIAGWNRTLNDYTNALVASGAAPEGAYLARYYPENPQFEGVQAEGMKLTPGLLYMIARGRAVKPPTQVEAYDRQIQKEIRKLKDLQSEQVDD